MTEARHRGVFDPYYRALAEHYGRKRGFHRANLFPETVLRAHDGWWVRLEVVG